MTSSALGVQLLVNEVNSTGGGGYELASGVASRLNDTNITTYSNNPSESVKTHSQPHQLTSSESVTSSVGAGGTDRSQQRLAISALDNNSSNLHLHGSTAHPSDTANTLFPYVTATNEQSIASTNSNNNNNNNNNSNNSNNNFFISNPTIAASTATTIAASTAAVTASAGLADCLSPQPERPAKLQSQKQQQIVKELADFELGENVHMVGPFTTYHILVLHCSFYLCIYAFVSNSLSMYTYAYVCMHMLCVIMCNVTYVIRTRV
jgi:hypothetical protein